MREYRTLGLRLMLISLVCVMALAAVNMWTAPIIEANKGGGAGPGTITATAPGFSGNEVSVTVTFNADGTIAAVTADVSTQTPGIGDKAGQPEFLEQFVGKTSAEGVDTIAGATYSSSAVIEAINKACEQFASGGGASNSVITETAQGYSGNLVSVTVTFNADGTIAAVTADVSTQTPGIGDQAGKPEFLDQFVGKTSAEGVDTIAGATFSSTAVIEAVNKACEQFAASGGSGAGNVITETAGGYNNNPVTVTVTFNADGTIASVTADVSTQTPGIGDQAGKPEFLDQFVGKTSAEGVDTIAGATFSSTAVIEAINKACAQFSGN